MKQIYRVEPRKLFRHVPLRHFEENSVERRIVAVFTVRASIQMIDHVVKLRRVR